MSNKTIDRAANEVASVLAALGRAEAGASMHTPYGAVRVVARQGTSVVLRLEQPVQPWR